MRVSLVVRLIAVGAVVSVLAAVGGNSTAKSDNVVLVYNGPAIANTHAAPQTAAYNTWCNPGCVPSVALPVYDVQNGIQRGTIYVWTTPLITSGNSLCFGEFIWYALNDGDVYTSSGHNGTCGAFIDSSLKLPTHITGPGGEVAGGGDGTIVPGGTGKYKNWTGTYTDRVFVELSFGGTNYYDQLFFSISRS
jgi:hypothetical protein